MFSSCLPVTTYFPDGKGKSGFSMMRPCSSSHQSCWSHAHPAGALPPAPSYNSSEILSKVARIPRLSESGNPRARFKHPFVPRKEGESRLLSFLVYENQAYCCQLSPSQLLEVLESHPSRTGVDPPDAPLLRSRPGRSLRVPEGGYELSLDPFEAAHHVFR